eukprot:2502880-Ditylum_brightwellii.AAC.1
MPPAKQATGSSCNKHNRSKNDDGARNALHRQRSSSRIIDRGNCWTTTRDLLTGNTSNKVFSVKQEMRSDKT